ncbi:MAG: DUF885 family protein [Fuerstiella sp.]|nr:DUF885 family protein [Fuerstiella sp.]
MHATSVGDHRFDGELDQISFTAREQRAKWIRSVITQLEQIDATQLSRSNQVDYALLSHALDAQLWKLTELREWEWNPLIYTGLTGDAIYSLMAREFAPQRDRLNNVALRLEQFPRFLKQVRENLDVERVPPVHARTAAAQNRGVLKTIDNMVRPLTGELSDLERNRLVLAIGVAEQAIAEQQRWLDAELVPNAKGDVRLGIDFYEKKLGFALNSPLSREEIRDLAARRVQELHEQMYKIAKEPYREQYPLTQFPQQPTDEFRRAVIRFGLEKAYARAPRADTWLDTPLPEISDADRKRTNRDISKAQAGDYFRTVYDLMVLAFQTDVTRVATFSLGGEGDAFAIPEIGITESRHQLSHHGGDEGYMEKLTSYDTFAIEQFGYFPLRLDETKDVNGRPLLGSTMALFGSGMSYGHSHGNANLPLVFAGGADLGLKHGSHLDFNQGHFDGYTLDMPGDHYRLCSRPANTDAHMSNLLLLMAQRMGVETDRFGDSNRGIEL